MLQITSQVRSRRLGRIAFVGFLLAAQLASAQNYLNPAIAPGYPNSYPTGRWQLGVQVQNTNTGVQLTTVIPGSAAANGGLTVGDRILAVGGQQVGYVDGRLIDLGDAINQSIGATGQVTFLTYSARTGQVQSIPMVLTSTGGALRGTAVYQGAGVRLGPQAMLTVVLRDVSYNNWTGVVIAQTTASAYGYNPIPFQLSYNPAQCYAGHQYALEASIVDNGQVVLQTASPAAFNPLSPGAAPALVLAPYAVPLGGGVGVIPGAGLGGAPYDQITQWYVAYLGRQPTPQELAAWQTHLQQGRSLNDIQAYLLGSTEYYDRSRNDPQQYVRGVYRSIYGVDPNAQQFQTWQKNYNQSRGLRSQFVQQLLRERHRQ